MTATATASPIALFLAHALALENDAAERYAELADSLAVHNNPEVAELFRTLGTYSRKHYQEVAAIADGVGPIPRLAPWEFSWATDEPPETSAFADTNYLMTPRDALELALKAEQQGYDYYAKAAAQASDPEVRRLATHFAAEEAEHVETVTDWLARFPAAPKRTEDLDPPQETE